MSCQGLFPIFSKHGQKNIHHTRNCGFHSLEFPHTQFHAGFICNFLSSSAGFNLCSCFFPAHPCLPLSLPTFSGPDLHTACRRYPVSFLTPAVFAFFRPLQFWVLTTQPLFLLFPLLPVSASQWLPQCSALAFAPSVSPVLSCLVSRAFFPGSGTQLRCMFPFALPRFAPTAVPRVLAFRFRFPHFPYPVSLPFVR